VVVVGDVFGEALMLLGDLNSRLSSSKVNAGVTCRKADFEPLSGIGIRSLTFRSVESSELLGS